MSKSTHRNFTYIMYFVFCMLTVLSFTYGYLHTTGRINNSDSDFGIGAYEGTKGDGTESDIQDVTSHTVLTDDTLLTMRTSFGECGHTVSETEKLPNDLKNLTEMEFKLAYKDWTVEKFTVEEIIITRKMNSKCPNHYIVKVKDNKLAVYYQNAVNGITLKETTNISVDSLPRNDRQRLEQGILVDSDEVLAELLEAFGS